MSNHSELCICYNQLFNYDPLASKIIKENNQSDFFYVKNSKFENDQEFKKFLNKDYDNIRLVISNEFYSLIPNTYLHQEINNEDLRKVTDILFDKTGDEKNNFLIKCNRNENSIPTSIFMLSKSIYNKLNNFFFPNILKVSHQNDIILTNAFNIYKKKYSDQKYMFFIYVYKDNINIVIFKNHELLFFNVFSIETKNDILYYFEVTKSVLKIPKNTKIEIISINNDKDLIKTIFETEFKE